MEWLWAPIRRAINDSGCWLTVLWIATEHNTPSEPAVAARLEPHGAVKHEKSNQHVLVTICLRKL